jgi:transcriptional regulator GlxA family with amidase domain
LTPGAFRLTFRAMSNRFASGAFSVTILVLPGSSLMCVASVAEPWRALGRVRPEAGAAWRIVSLDGGPVQLSSGMAFAVQGALAADLSGDLLAVIGGIDALEHARPALGVLRALGRRFGRVAGIESGAWVLGGLGLLEGRRATAHWEDHEDFLQRHPGVDVRPDRWVADGRVLTAGGASPAFDLMLHLIRERWGPAAAMDVASVFVYDETRAASEPQPAVSMGRLAAREPRVAAAVRAMEGALDRPLPAQALARRAGVSLRRLEMLFREALGTSPAAYYLSLRLGAARRLVTDTALPFAEVAERTGFASLSAFSRAFRRHTGTTARAARAAARAGRDGP